MLVDKDPFLTRSNYVELTNEFDLDVNVVYYYKYEDPKDAHFLFEAYLLEGKSSIGFIKRL